MKPIHENLKEWQAKVEQEEGKMAQANKPVGPTYTCPSCAATLRHHNGALVVFHQPDAVAPSDSQEKLREYRNARDVLHRSVENDRRDLASADAAAKALAEIESSGAEPAPAPEEIAAAAAGVAATKKALAVMESKLKELEADERLAEQADKRTEAAQRHHCDVAQWESVADALAPSGIPGELLAEALGPINERLARSSSIADWLRIGIQADMTIAADGGRPYAMLSRLGYDFATCTVCASNAAQKKVLARAGWRILASFVSSKTVEPVELWGFAVREEHCSEGSAP